MCMSVKVKVPHMLRRNEYKKMSPTDKGTHVKGILRQILELNHDGVTIAQLKQHLTFDRRIIEKHLDVMMFTNEIYVVQLGMNKLYIPNHKAMHEAVSYSEQIDDIEYRVYILHNKLGDFAVIQQTDLKQDVTGSLQVPLEHYDKLVKYLSRSIKDMESRGFR